MAFFLIFTKISLKEIFLENRPLHTQFHLNLKMRNEIEKEQIALSIFSGIILYLKNS